MVINRNPEGKKQSRQMQNKQNNKGKGTGENQTKTVDLKDGDF